MANRARETKVDSIGTEMDFEFSLSQQSNESDAHQEKVYVREIARLEICAVVHLEAN